MAYSETDAQFVPILCKRAAAAQFEHLTWNPFTDSIIPLWDIPAPDGGQSSMMAMAMVTAELTVPQMIEARKTDGKQSFLITFKTGFTHPALPS